MKALWIAGLSLLVILGGLLFVGGFYFPKTGPVPKSDDVAATTSTPALQFVWTEPTSTSDLQFALTGPTSTLDVTEASALALPVASATPTSSVVGSGTPSPLKTQPVLTPKVIETKPDSPLNVSTTELIGPPLFLKISKLNIHAAVQEVGLTLDSAMGIPTNYIDVGWFRFGPRPGQIGNATMDGHVVTRSFGAGVFSGLHTLVPGDEVEVETDRERLVFKVIKVAIYDTDSAPREEIFGLTAKRMLNLITCDGVWDQGRKMYDKRLVVFTELVRAVER